MISKKICLVGDFGVGKTSLIRRFVDAQFSDQYLSSVGVKISRKVVEITPNNQPEKLKLQMLIWDLEGSNKFKAIAPAYLQGAKGTIVVADMTRIDTIERVSGHIDNFLEINPQGFLVVALNKSDLVDEEKLSKLLEMVQSQAQDRVIGIYPTSAKTGIHVDLIFETLACAIIEKE